MGTAVKPPGRQPTHFLTGRGVPAPPSLRVGDSAPALWACVQRRALRVLASPPFLLRPQQADPQCQVIAQHVDARLSSAAITPKCVYRCTRRTPKLVIVRRNTRLAVSPCRVPRRARPHARSAITNKCLASCAVRGVGIDQALEMPCAYRLPRPSKVANLRHRAMEKAVLFNRLPAISVL